MTGILSVGLTGGIACGRTTLSRYLRRPRWLVLDADAIVHALLSAGGDAVPPVLKAFGPGAGDPSRGIDRKALGARVFADGEARRRLEGIVHPLVHRSVDGEMARFAAGCPEGIVVVDAALMIETGSYKRYDRLVVAHCPPDVQLERVMARDGMTAKEALRRIAAQAPLDEKIALAHYTIDTGGSRDETRRRTEEVAGMLEEDLRRKIDGTAPGAPS